ncbi:MAG: hypothetical protein B7Z77_00960 [Acidocella sp. 20-58-15]|nr:MAG: hypothetical protein B7Z77_00960 [Acidocella sp. 20-58-15]
MASHSIGGIPILDVAVTIASPNYGHVTFRSKLAKRLDDNLPSAPQATSTHDKSNHSGLLNLIAQGNQGLQTKPTAYHGGFMALYN